LFDYINYGVQSKHKVNEPRRFEITALTSNNSSRASSIIITVTVSPTDPLELSSFVVCKGKLN